MYNYLIGYKTSLSASASADSPCKKYEPRSDTCSGFKLFDTLKIFQNMNFENKQQTTTQNNNLNFKIT